MDVSVIIVNYNTRELTKQCIDSVFSQTEGVVYEVILVDNNSIDGSIEAFSRDTRIIFIPLDENIGFGKANNAGLKSASGKYIFFLNSDTYLLNNAIKEFYDFAEMHQKENVGGVGCRLLKTDMSYCHSYGLFPSFWGELWKPIILPISRAFGKTYQYLDKPEHNEDVFPVGYVTGADLFVSKKIIDSIGAFDPDFFMYYEESEMQYRWSKAGFMNYIISTPQIVHLEGGCDLKNKTVVRNVEKELVVYNSLFLYMKKTSSSMKYLLFRFCFAMIKLPFLLFSSLPWQDRKTYATLFFRFALKAK